MKKWIGLFLAFCFFFTGCSLQNMSEDLLLTIQEQDQAQSSEYSYELVTQLRIPIGESTLNPYGMTIDTNLRVVPLLYDSLTKLNPTYGYDLCIASSVNIQGNVCMVSLRQDILFSDGTPLTARDVLYSYRQAVATSNQFSGLFSNVTDVAAVSDYEMRFTLASSDVLFPNLLTFPVIKNASAAAPVGSGRYMSSEDKKLIPNPHWYGGDVGKIQSITLVQQPDRQTSLYSMRTGAVEYLFSETDETISESGGSVQYVPMPNLLYIGINDSAEFLSDVRFRQMLQAAMDRKSLLENSYYDRVQMTSVPFPASWVQLQGLQTQQGTDFEKVQLLLAELGLDKRDDEGYIIMGTKRVSIDILVNSENSSKVLLAQSLRESLRSLGIAASVLEETFETYQTRIAQGQYDLYLGEIKLKDNLDLTSLFGSYLKLTGAENVQTVESYRQWRQGTGTLENFLTQFSQSVPFIPIGTRNGILYYSRGIYYDLSATAQDIFYNIQMW